LFRTLNEMVDEGFACDPSRVPDDRVEQPFI